MAMGNSSGHGGLNADMNVTPFIDVLLVLLIIFLMITPVIPNGLDARIPQRATNPNHDSDAAIVVQVFRNHDKQLNYKINQEDVAVNNLGDRLSAILSVRADKTLFIKGAEDLEFSTVAQVIDIGKGAGAEHIGSITPKGIGA